MPPSLYFYINYCIILDEDEKGKSVDIINPLLRDIEWILSYGYLTCQGFSGFEEDDEYTCNRLVDKLEKSIELSPKEKINLDSSTHVLKKDGTYKKYIEAREYLYGTFKKPLGRPIYENDLRNLFILGSRSTGKDLEENTLVYKENESVKIKDINIGDRIYGRDGELTTVIDKKTFKDQIQYKITLQDNREIECGGGHLWTVRDAKLKDIKLKTLSTEFLYENINKRKRGEKYKNRKDSYWFIPLNEPVNYPEINLPIDPYFLGLWLGDGCSHRTAITTEDEEIVNYLYNLAEKEDLKVTINYNISKTCPTYHLTKGNGKNIDRAFNDEFKKLNLFRNKHIPEIYLRASIEQRRALLDGLIATDGYIGKGGTVDFSNSNKQLIDGVEKLARSLGIYCKVTSRIPKYTHNGTKREGKRAYRVFMRPEECPTTLTRKKETYDRAKKLYKNKGYVGIKNIEKLKIKPSVCIGVDNGDKLFIAGNYITTHNSFSIAGIMAHCYNFYNKKYYDEKYLNNPAPAEILVGSAQSAKSAELVKKFLNIQEYLKTDPGAFGKGDQFIPGYFYNNSIGKSSPNNVDSPYRHEYKVQQGKIWVTKGTGTKLLHVAYADNPEAAVGYRPNLLIVEEVGLLNNLLQTHGSNELSLIRRNRTGISIYLGTSGDMEKITESKIIFEDPESYDFLPYPDVWENRSKPIGLFIPAYYADSSFKDDLGNTNLDLAYEQELINRKKKEQASNSAALDSYMMSRPIVPSEMFLSSSTNLFPTAKLRQREAEIETKNLFNIYASIGDLEWSDTDKKSVKWIEDLTSKRDKRVIKTLNLDQHKTDMRGAIVIYEHPPEYIPTPSYRKSLYKVVYDPVKDDGGGTSLCSILVHKGHAENWNSGLQDSIVAEYIGRWDQVDDMHEIALKIAHYFNAMILVENNIPGFINYCKVNGYVHKLQMTPYEAITKGIATYSKKYEYGITMSKPLAVHCEQLIRQWLLEPWIEMEGGLKLNLDKLLSLRIIRELTNYDREKNFDHISSLKILLLWLSQERDVVFKEEDVKADPYDDLNKYFKSVVIPKQKNPWYA